MTLTKAPDLKPRSTSALADRAFDLYREHFTALFLLGLFSQTVPILTQIFITEAGLNHQSLDDSLPTLLNKGGIVMGLFLVSAMFNYWGSVAVTHAVTCICFGKRVSLRASLYHLLCSLPKVTWSFAWVSAVLFIPFFLPFVVMAGGGLIGLRLAPGSFVAAVVIFGFLLLVLIASLFPLLVTVMRLFLVVPVSSVEGLCGARAIFRSSKLVGFDPGLGPLYWGEMRLSLLLLPLFVIQVLFTFLSFGLTWVIDGLFGSQDSFSSSTDPGAIPNLVFLSLSSALFFPLTVLMYTLFYFDVRARREGFDLECSARHLMPVVAFFFLLAIPAAQADPVPTASRSTLILPTVAQFRQLPETDPAQIRQDFANLQKRPEFLSLEEDDLNSSFEDWLSSFFIELNSRWTHFKYAREMQNFSYFLNSLFVLLVFLTLLLLFRRLVRPRNFRAGSASLPVNPHLRTDSPTDLETELAQAEAQENWPAALSAQWRLFLLKLLSLRKQAMDPTLTNHEYLRLLMEQNTPSGQVEAFADLVHEFDLIIYGRQLLGKDQWLALRLSIQKASNLFSSTS